MRSVPGPRLTPKELRKARRQLGLTQNQLAAALKMGANGYQSVGRWERDGNTIPGPVQVAVELLLEKQEWVAIPRMGDVA